MDTVNFPPRLSPQRSSTSAERVNVPVVDGRLKDAILTGQIDHLQRLLDTGGDVNAATDEFGGTLLILAIKRGRTGCARVLIERGAYLGRTSTGVRPLTVAARLRSEEICRALIDGGAQVNGCDGSGKTALYEAVINERPALCRLLIDAGADVHEETRFGSLPLNIVAVSPQAAAEEIVRILVAGGASPSKLPSQARTKSEVALSAFQAAVQRGTMRHVEYFLHECGEDPKQTTTDGRTMLELTTEPLMQELLRSAMTGGALERTLDGHADSQKSILRAKGLSPL